MSKPAKRRPEKITYRVMLLDDPQLHYDLITEVLMTIFRQSYERALDTVMQANRLGKAEIMRGSHDVAVTKVRDAGCHCILNSRPLLRLTFEKVSERILEY